MCPHLNTIPGLDARFCQDCRHWLLDKKAEAELAARRAESRDNYDGDRPIYLGDYQWLHPRSGAVRLQSVAYDKGLKGIDGAKRQLEQAEYTDAQARKSEQERVDRERKGKKKKARPVEVEPKPIGLEEVD